MHLHSNLEMLAYHVAFSNKDRFLPFRQVGMEQQYHLLHEVS